MRLLEPDLYEEAAELLFQRTCYGGYEKLKEGLAYHEQGEKAEALLAACSEMMEACRDIPLPDKRFLTSLGGNRHIIDMLWWSYYCPSRKEKPSAYMLSQFEADRGSRFIRQALGIYEIADRMEESELKKAFLQAEFPMELKYQLIEICMDPEPFFTELCDLVEQTAEVISPLLKKYRPLYSCAESFFASPDAARQLLERLPVKIEDESSLEILPMLTGLNLASMAAPELEEGRYVLELGLLFLVMDIFDGEQELKPEILSERLRCFTDETKLKILEILKEGDNYQAAMAKLLKLTPATVSHHLDYLMNQGMISDEVRENRVYYHLERQRVNFLADELKRIFGADERNSDGKDLTVLQNASDM